MKKTAVLLILCMILTLCACGAPTQQKPIPSEDTDPELIVTPIEPESPQDVPSLSLPNPVMRDVEAEALLRDFGVDLNAMDRYEDTSYARIDGDPVLGQVTFRLNGDTYCYRIAAPAAETDISGMYYTWDIQTEASVGHNTARLGLTNAGQGIISWYDIAPGIMYSLSMTENATQDKLVSLAGELYSPVQGNADGVPNAQDGTEDTYASVLSLYRCALREGWGWEKYVENSLNPLCSQISDVNQAESVGYLELDLDGDGSEELLIGAISEDEFYKGLILELYHRDENGSIVSVFSSTERDRYYSAGLDAIGTVFVHTGSSSAFDSFETIAVYANGVITESAGALAIGELPLIPFSTADQTP